LSRKKSLTWLFPRPPLPRRRSQRQQMSKYNRKLKNKIKLPRKPQSSNPPRPLLLKRSKVRRLPKSQPSQLLPKRSQLLRRSKRRRRKLLKLLLHQHQRLRSQLQSSQLSTTMRMTLTLSRKVNSSQRPRPRCPS